MSHSQIHRIHQLLGPFAEPCSTRHRTTKLHLRYERQIKKGDIISHINGTDVSKLKEIKEIGALIKAATPKLVVTFEDPGAKKKAEAAAKAAAAAAKTKAGAAAAALKTKAGAEAKAKADAITAKSDADAKANAGFEKLADRESLLQADVPTRWPRTELSSATPGRFRPTNLRRF